MTSDLRSIIQYLHKTPPFFCTVDSQLFQNNYLLASCTNLEKVVFARMGNLCSLPLSLNTQ